MSTAARFTHHFRDAEVLTPVSASDGVTFGELASAPEVSMTITDTLTLAEAVILEAELAALADSLLVTEGVPSVDLSVVDQVTFVEQRRGQLYSLRMSLRSDANTVAEVTEDVRTEAVISDAGATEQL